MCPGSEAAHGIGSPIPAGLDLVVALMNVGELAQVKIAAKYGYDTFGR